MKNLWIDLETTGLDPTKHGVIQISGIVEIDGEVTEEFNYKVKPLKGDGVTKKALEVNQITVEGLRERDDPASARQSLLNILNNHIDAYDKHDKFFMLGYNSKFDYDFLRKWFEKQNYGYFGSYFWFPPIDIMNLVAYQSQSDRMNFRNFKLGTVAQQYGIELQEESLHDAFYDITITRELYHRVKEKGLNGSVYKATKSTPPGSLSD